jgi:hypothetical protein
MLVADDLKAFFVIALGIVLLGLVLAVLPRHGAARDTVCVYYRDEAGRDREEWMSWDQFRERRLINRWTSLC